MGFQRGDADTLSLVSLLPRAEEGALFAGVAPGRPANKTLDAPNRWKAAAPARGTGSASTLLFDECFRQRERAVPVLGDTFEIGFNRGTTGSMKPIVLMGDYGVSD